MSDLVERLRGKNAKHGRYVPLSIYTEAADRIEALKAERDSQYDQNVEQIARIAKLEANQQKQAQVIINYMEVEERLRGVLAEVHRLVSYAQHRDAINLINKALAAVQGEGDE